ncbi:RNA polymerase II-associated protein 3 [Armadillidium nasatum]|uniref:RNA polymerase II-associated protein 3 n=1 Tax=Armadillidium nasatum TaxID=96803 RepID=A0A5N5TI68_9CRUS|nr:RNA polymerase II-associated protein 3 [Armadillidium nasatum]
MGVLQKDLLIRNVAVLGFICILKLLNLILFVRMTLQEIQLSAKNNSEELQDYLRDLKHWEEGIKQDDLDLKKKKNLNVKDMSIESKKDNKSTKLETEVLRESNSGNNKTQHTPMIPDHHKGKAEKLKEEGNKLYAQGKYSDAVGKYTQGIGLDSSNKLLPANRAMALIKLGKFKAAEKDCSKALALDPCYIKAYLRRATARMKTSNIPGAIKDYEMALELEPWNKTTRKELEKLKMENVLDEDVPPLEESPLVLNKVTSKNIENIQVKKTDNEKIPLSPKSSFQKPLVKISVEKVSSREKLDELLDTSRKKESSIKTSKNITTNIETFEKLPDVSNGEKLDVPPIPKTSHQFSQDWKKVSKSSELTHLYLKKIPVSFFDGIEIEVELLIEIFSTICDKYLDNEEAALIVESLMKTRGFSINMAFLDQKQKEVNSVIRLV